ALHAAGGLEGRARAGGAGVGQSRRDRAMAPQASAGTHVGAPPRSRGREIAHERGPPDAGRIPSRTAGTGATATVTINRAHSPATGGSTANERKRNGFDPDTRAGRNQAHEPQDPRL